MGRLDGLDEAEQAACVIAERSLGVVAQAWDVDGRQGEVDAMLAYPDGRTAAFEVTKLAADGALWTEGALAATKHFWPSVGDWAWTVSIGAPRDIAPLKKVYGNIIRCCEAADVERPHDLLGWTPNADSDLKWLVQQSSSRMTGHRSVPAAQWPGVMVVPQARGGAIDDSMSGFAQALGVEFQQPHIPDHFDKLKRAKADERQLFVPLHDSALPFRIASALIDEALPPPEPPPVPDFIDFLWIAPRFSRRVLVWNRADDSWKNYFPYDT
ncbi:hypothetical protein [Mycobacterium haemophilum]